MMILISDEVFFDKDESHFKDSGQGMKLLDFKQWKMSMTQDAKLREPFQRLMSDRNSALRTFLEVINV